MAKIVLDTVTGGYDLSVINNNFDKIETELQNKVLYRNNPVGEANTLETDIDANGKRIYNLPEPLLNSEPARLQDLQNAVAGGAANLITFTPYGHVAGSNVQAAIQELVDDTTNNGVALPAFLKDNNTIVVDSIAALKAIDKTKFTKALVLGYYAKGDGGGGVYWFDSSDTTSADNSGTIIVATDLGRWKLIFQGSVSVKQFGAKGDGVANDTTAFASAISAVNDVTVPSGTYVISQLNITKNNLSISGFGSESTILLGNNSTNDIVLIGDGVAEVTGLSMEGLTIDSSVTKTAGAAIHSRKLVRSSFEDIRCCGQDRFQALGKKLWNGFWFDSVDYVNLSDFQSVAQNDGLIVNGAQTYGTGPQGNLFLSHGKIMVCGAAGIRMAGGFGGLTILSTDVIQNSYGLLVDATVVPNTNQNREVFLGIGAFFDGSTNENIVIISNTLQKFTASGAWACTSTTAEGVRVGSMAGQFVWTGGNVKGNARSGFRFDDPNTQHIIVGADIANNTRYGIEWTVPPSSLDAAVVIGNLISNNTLGATLNLPYATLGAGSSSSVKLQTTGVTNGDVEISGAGSGLLNYLGSNTAGTATAGAGGALPAQVAGYLKIKSNGTELRIPYYNV